MHAQELMWRGAEPLTVLRLLRRHARGLRAQDLERARNQVLLRRLRAHERPGRRLEDAALALLTCERLPDDDQTRVWMRLQDDRKSL